MFACGLGVHFLSSGIAWLADVRTVASDRSTVVNAEMAKGDEPRRWSMNSVMPTADVRSHSSPTSPAMVQSPVMPRRLMSTPSRTASAPAGELTLDGSMMLG